MREIARVAQGYFPTPPRIVHAISRLIAPSSDGTDTVLDAGCGCGVAIDELRLCWMARATTELSTKLYGIESDRERCRQAHVLLAATGGEAFCASIEDCTVEGGASLLWFNPPYDRIRGAGRLELELFNRVKGWCAKNGILVLIVPDYVLADRQGSLACAVERHFQTLSVFRFPEPEYQTFKQCVLIGQRRDKPLSNSRVEHPRWACRPELWPVLNDNPPELVSLPRSNALALRRIAINPETIQEVISRSPLRNSLLRDALASAAVVERPLLPLKPGHLALALAGGLCDGIVEANGLRFLVKGALTRKTCHTACTQRTDADGRKTADVDVFRTVYAMNVRCLREDGSIEEYTSNDQEEAANSEADSGDPNGI